jgi:hypothetical protein
VLPKTKVTYIRPKKLLAGLSTLNAQKVMRSLRVQILNQVKHKLLQSTLSDRAKKALTTHLTTEMTASKITLLSTHPALIPLIKGRKGEQMTWLAKAGVPIPIVTKSGKLIFRNATPKSMAEGKWKRPEIDPTTLLENARRATRDAVKKKIKVMLKRELKGKNR